MLSSHGKRACPPYKNNCARRGSNPQPTAPEAVALPGKTEGVAIFLPRSRAFFRFYLLPKSFQKDCWT